MSGGVDSSVVAALLIEQGHCVRGVTARFWREHESDSDVVSARAACAHLGIDHEVVDLRDEFYARVVQRFVREYAAGRTPNPCIICNHELKFGLLLQRVLASGDDFMASGHYARIVRGVSGWQLLTARDAAKDQSYFLYTLGQEQLAHLLFPLGDWLKVDTIAYARRRGLNAADRAQSQDVCFVTDGDYRRFLHQHVPELLRPGPIEDDHGRVLGEHRGLALYTVGQREGLGIATGEPTYVLKLDAVRNALVVGTASALGQSALLAKDMTYTQGKPPDPALALSAKIRSRSRPVGCRLQPLEGGSARIDLALPQRDIAPGQAVVVYNGDAVIAGGTIACTLPRSDEVI